MTCSRSNTNQFRAGAGRGLLLIALCCVTGLAAAQDGGTRYAKALADAEITQRYNANLQNQLRSQESKIASLQQQIGTLDQTAEAFQPLLQRMFDELEKFVAADVPFLPQERQMRIERLRDLMGNPEATASEKYR